MKIETPEGHSTCATNGISAQTTGDATCPLSICSESSQTTHAVDVTTTWHPSTDNHPLVASTPPKVSSPST